MLVQVCLQTYLLIQLFTVVCDFRGIDARSMAPNTSSFFHLTSYIMSEISDAIQNKCLAFGDRVIKLNDYLLKEAANAKPTYKIVKGKRVYDKPVPVYLQSVSNLCNQLLRAGTSIGANNAEASSAISKADFKSKSYIALKEAKESLYWLELLHRNNFLTDVQFFSIYTDAEELVKVLTHRYKKLDEANGSEK